MTRGFRTTPFAIGLLALAALPKCSCETDPGITRASVKMELTFLEQDPCSGVEVPRKIPDDLNGRTSTDLGSRATRTFEIRSRGSVALKVSDISLSTQDPEYTLTVTDGLTMMPATFPFEVPSSADQFAPAGLIVKVDYAAADSEPDLVELVVKSDDPDRQEVRFGLTAGRGKIQVCGTNGCDTPEVQFGNVTRDTSSTKQVTIKNVGDGDLEILDVRLDVLSQEFCAPEATTLPEGFSSCVQANQCRVLRPGETYTVNLTYTPVDGGSDTGFVHVRSGDATAGTIDVPINGSGAGPGLCFCVVDGANCNPAQSVDFGAVAVGQAVSRVMRIQSCGTDPANLSEAVLETMPPIQTGPEFTISRPFATGMYPAGMYAEGEITYLPTGSGTHTGALRYALQAARTPSYVTLIGRAATCDLAVFPDNISFGTIASGSNADRNVVLVNNGARDCTVTGISDPANTAFTIVNKPALPLTVTSGASVPVTVRYTAPARAMPAPDMSSFDVTGDATKTVTLTAQGGGQAVCDVEVLPNNASGRRNGVLNFGATNIGYTKTLAIRITNRGTADCTLQSASLMSTAASQFRVALPPLPATIGAGLASVIDVTFAPTMQSLLPTGYTSLAHSVDLTLAGPGLTMTAYSIGLSGRPTTPSIDVIPDSLDFGVVTWERPVAAEQNRSSCGSEVRQVRIYNSGTGGLNISSIEIEAASDPLFRVSGVRLNGTAVPAPYMMAIPPGQFAEVDVRFFPTRTMPAEHRGNLVINNDVTMQIGVPMRGEGTSNARQTDRFTQLADNKVDILWVVDDSGSMSEEQNLLANNFASFVALADMANVDYQIGVITTEINDAPAGKLWACNGFNKIIRRTDANRAQAFSCAANVTTPPNGNRRPNPMGSDEAEAGLQAARLALDAPVRDTDNMGFLRPDARLAVVVVSDEEDQSPGPTSLYVDFMRNIKGFRNPQLMSLSVIVGDPGSGCATAEAGDRYFDAANQLNGQFESICTSNWAPMLSRIGLGVFTLRTAWSLSRGADAMSITVTVGGVPVAQNATNGWTYDATTNSVEFHGSSVPQPGSEIVVQYGALCRP